MRLRRLVRDSYAELLEKEGVLAIPAADGNKFEQLALYAIAPLCGFASVSLAYKGEPTQLLCKHGDENMMFDLVSEVSV